MDICEVTPDAPQCQAAKSINLGEEAKKTYRAEIYAVQQQYVIKAHRLEIMPYWQVSLNDQFVSHDGPGLALNYYITQVLAVGLNGNFYQGLNTDSDFNFQNRRAARIAVPLNDYQLAGDLNFTYVPMYGKFAGFGDFIFHYDAFLEGGLGVIRTELPFRVIDPDNRKFSWNTPGRNFDVGIGLRYLLQSLAGRSGRGARPRLLRQDRGAHRGCGINVVAHHRQVESGQSEHVVRPRHSLHERRATSSRPVDSPADVLRIPVAQVKTETRTAMKRRFVTAVLAVVAATGVTSVQKSASAQEIQLTGPLKGAPAVRHLRLYRKGRVDIDPTFTFSLLDEYRRTILVGGRLNYNITDWFAIGVWGAGGVINTDTKLATEIDSTSPRDALTAVNVNHTNLPGGGYGSAPFTSQTGKLDWVVTVPNLTFTPFRGKLAIFNKIFVDTDLYISAGLGIVGIDERGDCGAAGQLAVCADPKSFALTSRTKFTGTGAVGLAFYPGSFWSIGVEYRALPFSWNRSGFDSRGSGTNGNFPDNEVNSKDETFRFNQFVTVSVGFFLPTAPRISE